MTTHLQYKVQLLTYYGEESLKNPEVIDRHREGLFYEYPEHPRGIYRNTPLQCPRF